MKERTTYLASILLHKHSLSWLLCVTVGQRRHSGCWCLSPWDSTPEGCPSVWHEPQTPASTQELQVKYAAYANAVENVYVLCIFFFLNESQTGFQSSLVIFALCETSLSLLKLLVATTVLTGVCVVAALQRCCQSRSWLPTRCSWSWKARTWSCRRPKLPSLQISSTSSTRSSSGYFIIDFALCSTPTTT